jgi:hypothetical protein
MQSHEITLAFHREMADSSRELVKPDITAAPSIAALTRSGKRDRHLTLRTLQPSRVATDEWPGPY